VFRALRFALATAPFGIMNRPRFALLLLLGAACVEQPPVQPLPEQIIPTNITASDRDLQPGENTTLTVTITNTLDEEVELVFPTQCQALFFIRNAAGRVMTPENGTHQCATVPSLLVIAAGAAKTFTMQWGGGVEFGAAGTSTRVPPGSYYAWAELRADNYHAIAFPISIVVH
jgi:hypothetical protein